MNTDYLTRQEPNVPCRRFYRLLRRPSVNTNADFETVEQVFFVCALAKRYHPDNDQTCDADKFSVVSKAFEVLSDPEKRAAYDAEYENKTVKAFRSVSRAASASGFANDQKIRDAILSIMYIARRQNVEDGGVGTWRLEKLLEWPEKELAFHIWYLKRKKLDPVDRYRRLCHHGHRCGCC